MTTGLVRFAGEIAGVGSTSGIRVVVGHWSSSPYGGFTDVMLEQADGWRVLLAPTEPVSAFIAGAYVFDETLVGPVSWDRRGSQVSVDAPGLVLSFTVGGRTPLGRLLQLVPPRLATAPLWSRLIGPVSGLLLPGVRTYGSAGGVGGRRTGPPTCTPLPAPPAPGVASGSGSWPRSTRPSPWASPPPRLVRG